MSGDRRVARVRWELAIAMASLPATGQAQSAQEAPALAAALTAGVQSCLAADDGRTLAPGRLVASGWKLGNIAGVATASKRPVVMLLTAKKKAVSGCMMMQEISSNEYKQTIAAMSQLLESQPAIAGGVFTWTQGDRRVQMNAVAIPWRAK